MPNIEERLVQLTSQMSQTQTETKVSLNDKEQLLDWPNDAGVSPFYLFHRRYAHNLP
jgi:hypothetical protein